MGPKKKIKKQEGAVWEYQHEHSWRPFADEDTALLEKAYLSEGETFTTGDLSFNKGYSTKYLFDFKAMTQLNRDSTTKKSIRRIGSSSDIAWEWVDDSGLFVQFFEEDTAEIERCYQAAGVGGSTTTKKLSFNAGYDSPYEFQFSKMDADGTTVLGQQKNKESGKVRSIKRLNKKPAAWETKGYGIAGAKVIPSEVAAALGDGGDDEEDESPKKKTSAEPAPLVKSNTMSIPSHWTKTTGGFEKVGANNLVELDSKSEEYTVIATALISTIPSKKVKVSKIVRVENATLWAFYAVHRAHIAKRNGGDSGEKMLFYGDRSAANMDTITRLGFDVRVAQSGNYGQGLYYGVNASYCNTGLCKENKDGSKEVFVCRAALGEYVKGSKGIRRPPPKDPKLPTGDIYDCCVDDVKNPSVYIMFNQAQAYPEYIVTYTA